MIYMKYDNDSNYDKHYVITYSQHIDLVQDGEGLLVGNGKGSNWLLGVITY